MTAWRWLVVAVWAWLAALSAGALLAGTDGVWVVLTVSAAVMTVGIVAGTSVALWREDGAS